MEKDKFTQFCSCFENAFQKLVSQYGLNVVRHQELTDSGGKRFSAVVGVVGLNKGRIHVEMGGNLVKKLFELANGEPEEDEMDLCFYLAEFTNIIAGNGITLLNDRYRGSNLRLTPPAIFTGENLDITTPKVLSTSTFYNTEFGSLRIEIGFEGV